MNKRPTYNGVEFCDLSATDKELVNQGIIESDDLADQTNLLESIDKNHPDFTNGLMDLGIDMTYVFERMNDHLDKEEGADYNLALVLKAALTELSKN